MTVSVADASQLAAIQAQSFARAGPGIQASWPVAQAMSADRLAAFLSAQPHGVLATVRPDGRPLAAPISFFVRAGGFWFATVAGQRLRNVRAHPYASFVIVQGEDSEHRAVSVEGAVRVHPPASELMAGWAQRHGTEPTWAAAMLELVPERLFSYAAESPATPR